MCGVLGFVLMLTCYYIITHIILLLLYIIHIISYYYILYSSLLLIYLLFFFSSFLLFLPIFISSSLPSHLSPLLFQFFLSHSSFPSHLPTLIHSIRVGTWIHLFILFHSSDLFLSFLIIPIYLPLLSFLNLLSLPSQSFFPILPLPL